MLTVLVILCVGACCWLAGYLMMARARERFMVRSDEDGSPYRIPGLVEVNRKVSLKQHFADAPRASWLMAALFVGACALSCLAGKGGPAIADVGNDLYRWVTGPNERVEALYQARGLGVVGDDEFREAARDLDIDDMIGWLQDTETGRGFSRDWTDREDFLREAVRLRDDPADQDALAREVIRGPGLVFGSWCTENALRESREAMHALVGSPPRSVAAVQAVIDATHMECTTLTDIFASGHMEDDYREFAARVLRVWQANYERETNDIMRRIYRRD